MKMNINNFFRAKFCFMYKLVLHRKYAKKLKKFAKQNIKLPELPKVIDLILQGKKLPYKYKDHKLKGKLKGLPFFFNR